MEHGEVAPSLVVVMHRGRGGLPRAVVSCGVRVRLVEDAQVVALRHAQKVLPRRVPVGAVHAVALRERTQRLQHRTAVAASTSTTATTTSRRRVRYFSEVEDLDGAVQGSGGQEVGRLRVHAHRLHFLVVALSAPHHAIFRAPQVHKHAIPLRVPRDEAVAVGGQTRVLQPEVVGGPLARVVHALKHLVVQVETAHGAVVGSGEDFARVGGVERDYVDRGGVGGELRDAVSVGVQVLAGVVPHAQVPRPVPHRAHHVGAARHDR
mmetsp:Transcript_26001/g.52223  ORF Transcript_26001/g.52223 Transcript_26001/m.52223 type:complete len:264 (-) Transcript_26001:555-1346(-)